jgi:hypothetical protein
MSKIKLPKLTSTAKNQPVHTTFVALGELIDRELSKIYIMTDSADIKTSKLQDETTKTLVDKTSTSTPKPDTTSPYTKYFGETKEEIKKMYNTTLYKKIMHDLKSKTGEIPVKGQTTFAAIGELTNGSLSNIRIVSERNPFDKSRLTDIQFSKVLALTVTETTGDNYTVYVGDDTEKIKKDFKQLSSLRIQTGHRLANSLRQNINFTPIITTTDSLKQNTGKNLNLGGSKKSQKRSQKRQRRTFRK